MIVDISGWGTGSSFLLQPHLPVSATEGATDLCRFKTVRACTCVHVLAHRQITADYAICMVLKTKLTLTNLNLKHHFNAFQKTWCVNKYCKFMQETVNYM